MYHIRMRTTALACAAVVPMALAAPAIAKGGDNDRKGASPAGYLGKTVKTALARSILDRLRNQKRARRVADTGAVDFVQGGPTRISRALAMTQIAVFDAVNAFSGKYRAYNDIGTATQGSSRDAAIAYAAHDVLVALYPAQKPRLDILLATDVQQINAAAVAINAGKSIGQASAAAMLARRVGDRSDDPETSIGGGGRVATGTTSFSGFPINDGASRPLQWSPDPLTPGAFAINAVRATPPFPAYVSGHATFGATTFGVLRTFIPNNTRFTFVSDEYNGQGVDPFGTPRPLVPVRFKSLQQAQEEIGISRGYNGVHWQYDNLEGQAIGEKIAAYYPSHAFQRARFDRDN